MPGQSDKRFPGAGPCMWCVLGLKWIPVGFIVTVVGWSYYAYVVQLCICNISSPVEKVIYILVYHILLIIFLWSYWQAVATKIGLVPQQYRFPPSEIENMKRAESEHERILIAKRFARNLAISNFTDKGAVRVCSICHHIKPDRTHHCSMCGHCVLKMDHHCAWLNNCVGFTNYKFFVLFLGYALIYCLFITFTTLQYFISLWKSEPENAGRSHILFLFFISLMFALCLLSLFGYHVYLTLYNRTTLESFRAPVFRGGPDKNGFSLGLYNNFQEVFGDDKRLWFLPVFTSLGDGVVFPVRSVHQRNIYNSLDNAQNRSEDVQPEAPAHVNEDSNLTLGDGVTFPQRCFDEESDTLLGGNTQWVDIEAGYAQPGFSTHQPLSE